MDTIIEYVTFFLYMAALVMLFVCPPVILVYLLLTGSLDNCKTEWLVIIITLIFMFF